MTTTRDRIRAELEAGVDAGEIALDSWDALVVEYDKLAASIDEVLFGSLRGTEFDRWLDDLRGDVEDTEPGCEHTSSTISHVAMMAILARLAELEQLREEVRRFGGESLTCQVCIASNAADYPLFAAILSELNRPKEADAAPPRPTAPEIPSQT